MKNRIVRWGILLLVGLGIGAGIGFVQREKALEGGVVPLADGEAGMVLKQPESTVVGGKTIGGDFSLTDHNGKDVTQADYANSYKLIFFGFTYCPAVCPTELQKITKVMDALAPEQAAKIQPLFITVDPERDTVEAMKSYVAQYHPKLVGLTGTSEQISAVMGAYRVYASKVENEHMEGYMMNHSAYTYLMSPDNKLVEIYPDKDTAEAIAADISARSL